MIRFFNVYKTYMRGVHALQDITLHIKKGEFCYIIGPSGAGKTTLLKLIYSAEKPTRGQILVHGKNIVRIKDSSIPYLRRNIGVVFQDFKLLKNLTVFDNVALTLEILGTPRRVIENKVYTVLKSVGLHTKVFNYPTTLSGGEQQRVAIARAVVNDPAILLADEPTGNLDRTLALEILELFRDINTRGTTVVFATHDEEILKRYCYRYIRLEKGKLVESALPSSRTFEYSTIRL